MLAMFQPSGKSKGRAKPVKVHVNSVKKA
jgi:hypothetical protein